MMNWLRRFFYSDDPIVRLAAALNEPEAEMRRELLRNNGVAAMSKNVGTAATYEWGRVTFPGARDYDLFVKRSDLQRACEVLGSLLEDHVPSDAEYEYIPEPLDDDHT